MKRFCRTIVVFLVFLSCANEGALTGGEADRIAPQILTSFPPRDSAGIATLRTFSFQFSERVDRNSVEENLRLFPLTDERLSFEWDGWKRVEVTLPDTLDAGKTYQLVLTRGYKDLHGVGADSEYKLAFSTEGELDSGELRATIALRNKMPQNLRLALFSGDTISESADYISDVSSTKSVQFSRIKEGTYRGVFFSDKNNDYTIDLADEAIAVPPILLSTTPSEKHDFFLNFTSLDTVPPSIESIDTVRVGVFQATLSENINTAASRLFFEDSLGNVVHAAHVFLLRNKRVQIFANVNALAAPFALNYTALEDLAGNTAKPFTAFTALEHATRIDTNTFALKSISIKDSSTVAEQLAAIRLGYSTDFLLSQDSAAVSARLLNAKTRKMLPLKLRQENSKTLVAEPQVPLADNTAYQFELRHNALKNWYGMAFSDTTAIIRFSTEFNNRFGELRLRVNAKAPAAIVEFYDVESGKKTDSRRIETNKEVLLNRVRAARYHIEIFLDANGNGELDSGHLFPYTLSETYYIHADTIPIRANWERVIQDIEL